MKIFIDFSFKMKNFPANNREKFSDWMNYENLGRKKMFSCLKIFKNEKFFKFFLKMQKFTWVKAIFNKNLKIFSSPERNLHQGAVETLICVFLSAKISKFRDFGNSMHAISRPREIAFLIYSAQKPTWSWGGFSWRGWNCQIRNSE